MKRLPKYTTFLSNYNIEMKPNVKNLLSKQVVESELFGAKYFEKQRRWYPSFN